MDLNNITNYSLVDGYKNLIRDEDSNAIVSTNQTEYEQYLALRSHNEEEDKKIQKIENDVATMKSDLNEIKNLLMRLAQ